MHLMHVAALTGLLGTLGGLGMGLPKLGALMAGTAPLPLATGMQIAMGLIFLILCVKSFIDAPAVQENPRRPHDSAGVQLSTLSDLRVRK